MSNIQYSGYEINEDSKNLLLAVFNPRYSKVIGHHITTEFGSDSKLPEDAKIYVVGHADSGDGLEVLVVEVNGTINRPDGSIYHITWSLESNYKPVDSNKLLKSGWEELWLDIPVYTTPKQF